MTYITLNSYYDDHILECTGHTGYATRGKDIICASVSILCLTIADYLNEAAKNGLISNLLCDISSGYANIRFTSKHGEEAEKCFLAITNGFKLLAECFPDHINYDA